MPGEWQVVERQTTNEAPGEGALNIGVRKRKLEDQEEDEEEEQPVVRRGWGSSTKRYPGDDKADLDDLLSSTIPLKKEKRSPSSTPQLKNEPNESLKQEDDTSVDKDAGGLEQRGSGKVETSSNDILVKGEADAAPSSNPLDAIPEEMPLPVFKKRKARAS